MSATSNQIILFIYLLCFNEGIVCVEVKKIWGSCFSPSILLRLGFTCFCVARSRLSDLQASGLLSCSPILLQGDRDYSCPPLHLAFYVSSGNQDQVSPQVCTTNAVGHWTISTDLSSSLWTKFLLKHLQFLSPFFSFLFFFFFSTALHGLPSPCYFPLHMSLTSAIVLVVLFTSQKTIKENEVLLTCQC